MILEKETFKRFGYHPNELKPKSGKKILAKCEMCGKIRELSKENCRDLCKSCAHKGIYHSEKTKKKISKTQQNMSIETKRKMSEAHTGKHLSEVTKKKMSEAKKNMSEDTKRKIGNASKGRKLSMEARNRLSRFHTGLYMSEESKKKMSEAKKGLYSGDKHPNWKGGISFEPYCILFNNEFKERVREFWDRKCIVCGKNEIENGRRLYVHHITYNKNTCCDDSIPLFIPLCNSCHSKTNYDRDYWMAYFIQLLYSNDITGKCFYSKKEMKIIFDNEKEVEKESHKDIRIMEINENGDT